MMRNEVMIKGEDPWGPNRKETLEQKLKYFCSKHHWDRGEQFGQMMDENGDGYVKPTLKLFLYNCFCELRGWSPIYQTRMLMQRLFRPDHLADNQIWEAQYEMAKHCLKVVKAYKKYDRHGYPGYFSDYDEEDHAYTKESYAKAKEEGKVIGGGMEGWNKEVDHIIMALEFVVHEGETKFMHDWYVKHFGMDPYCEDNECNKYIRYEYRYKDDKPNIGSHISFNEEPEDPDRCEYIKKAVSYGNTDLHLYCEEVVQYGLEKLGKYFRNFWD